MRELVGETDIGIIGPRGVGSRLIARIVVAVALGRILALLLARVEVALLSITGRILLLLLLPRVLLLLVLHTAGLLVLLLLLALVREDGLRKGRRRGGILSVAAGTQTIVLVTDVEVETVIITLHCVEVSS